MTTSSLSLPAQPDLEHLKKQAKLLLRAVRAQQPDALQIILTFHPRPAGFSTLRDAQLTLARRYGFSDWDQLRNECELRQLRGATIAGQADRLVHHACLRYEGDDQAWRYARASEWIRQLPQLPQRDFYCALVAADLKCMRDFLESDPTLALREGGPRNWPALFYLTYSRVEQSQENAVDAVRMLLEFGASPDSCAQNLQGFTAITGAVGEGERGPIACIPHPQAEALVTLLLDAGANPNQSQALYNSMLGANLGKWLPIFVRYGLKAGDKANWGPDEQQSIFDFLLAQVVVQGKSALVRYLLEQGADPNAVSRYNHRSCLNVARLTGRTEIAALLEQFGASAEPLSLADQFRIACDRHDTVLGERLLSDHPQLLDDQALLRDCAMVDAATCLWLVRHGFDINTRNQAGQTVLHNYALWNNPEAVRLLLQHGADPDLKEYHWQATALGMALHHHHWPVIEVLLPVSKDILDLCRMADASHAARLLTQDPALAKARTDSGNTALHLVSQTRQDDPDLDASIATIELLLKYGADPTARNKQGMIPEQWVRSLGMDEVADYMAERFLKIGAP
ncbi:MAG TPA: ankyrin repeat domain-containing protein [Steroidobacteraceae bacterium]|nr:ankyrin repeat domain-containing protein [Steroidobacteraceae bacterium]